MSSENIYFEVLGPLAVQYWWVILFMFAAGFIKLFAPSIKGKVGEGFVNLAAKLRLDPKVYHLIKDVTIPAKRGTTQIDHVIVSTFGIFVIETKNYKGWIFADANSRKWTQVNFKQKHQFQNPLRQNYAHICALAELLNVPKENIHGVVCFMGDAKFKKGIPDGVFLEGRYIRHIKSFQSPVFSEKEVADLIQQVESGRLERGFKTNRTHVRELKARHNLGAGGTAPSRKNGFAEKICPKCGAEMVLRTATRGTNAGNQFWGCSNFPSCRSTQPA